MARPCSICVHAHRESIDRELLRAEPYRNIAERFHVSLAALSRHHAGGHVLEELAKAHEAFELARSDRLLTEVDGLFTAAKRILITAEDAGDLRTALAAIREARAAVESLARVAALLPPDRARVDDAHDAFAAWLIGDETLSSRPELETGYPRC